MKKSALRLVVAGAAAVLFVAGPLAGVSSAAVAVTVTPNSNLHNGDTVHVQGSGLPPNRASIQVVQCVQGATDSTMCDGNTLDISQDSDAGGNVDNPAYVVHTLSVVKHDSINCDDTHPCEIWVGPDYNNAFSTNSGTAPITFAAIGATTTALASSANPQTSGHSVTFTATVSPVAPATGTPTGTVTFKNGSAVLGSSALSSGKATLATSTLTVGNHSITAIYGGSSSFSGSTSPVLTETITNTTTTLTSSVNPSASGQAVTFTATIAPVAPATGTPAGTVTFKDGTVTLGTATLASGHATFTTATLAVGRHSVTGTYNGGSPFFKSVSPTLFQTVNKAATTTGVVSSVNPSKTGQAVKFTATVAPVAPGTGTPPGTVTFKDGTTVLGSGALSAGKATFTTSSLVVGSHSITGSYGGSAGFGTSVSPALTQTVNKASTTTALTSSLNPSTTGQSVTFTATVSRVAPAAGTPTGSVTFKDGTAALGTVALSAGKATFSTSSLAIGTHSITAAYAGSTADLASTSPALSQTVRSKTTTAVASSANPSKSGQAVTFTATVSLVSPGTGTPTGTVTFKDGATTLGTAALSAGKATLKTSTLTVGAHSISAAYNGASGYAPSTSTALSQTVGKASTRTLLATSANPSKSSQAVTFTATVSAVAPGAGTPTGTVTFKDGTTTLGTVTLVSGTATFTTSTLAVGAHSITAVYNGSGTWIKSNSPAVSQTVNP